MMQSGGGRHGPYQSGKSYPASLDALRAHGASAHMAAYAAKTKELIASRTIHVLNDA